MEIDIKQPVPFEPESNVVFICIDLEWHELNHQAVTEVGIAILEAKDTIGVAPGLHCANWRALIKARHIRLKAYLNHRNSRFVSGHPDRFNFGYE